MISLGVFWRIFLFDLVGEFSCLTWLENFLVWLGRIIYLFDLVGGFLLDLVGGFFVWLGWRIFLHLTWLDNFLLCLVWRILFDVVGRFLVWYDWFLFVWLGWRMFLSDLVRSRIGLVVRLSHLYFLFFCFISHWHSHLFFSRH